MNIWKTTRKWTGTAWRAFKTLCRWVFTALVVLFMVLYVVTGMGSVQGIVEREINKAQDIAHLHKVIQNAVFDNRLEDVSFWLRQRPIEETAAIVEIVTEHSADLASPVFFDVATRLLKQEHEDDGLFWYLLARYRLRYDLLRCGAKEGVMQIDGIIGMFEPEAFARMQKDDARMKQGIQRVLQFDQEHPPENTPDYACTMLAITPQVNPVRVPEEKWGEIRAMLRTSAEQYVASP